MVRLLRRVRLQVRLLGGFGVICALLVASTAVGVAGALEQSRQTEQMTRLQALTRHAMELKFRSADIANWQVSYAWDVATLGGAAATSENAPNRKGFLAAVRQLQDELAVVPHADLSPAEAGWLRQVKESFTVFMSIDDRVVTEFRRQTPESIKSGNDLIVGEGYDTYYKIVDSTNKLVESVRQRSDTAQTATKSSVQRSVLLLLTSCALALVLAATISYLTTRSIVTPARRVVTGLRTLAQRDLSPVLPDAGRDELADMSAAFNQATEAMRTALTGVGQRAAALAGASRQLRELSESMDVQASDTSTKATEVASAADEISASAAVIADAASGIASSIGDVATSSATAAAVAGQAVTAAENTSHTVSQLSAASAEIGEIVKTITSIAEQTNLLALNATIEAARAGESGRGFAIVAGEVKELAQQAAQATVDITSKIESIQGTTVQAGAAIGEISAVVREISRIQATVAAAVEQQTATTDHINHNVNDLAYGSRQIASSIAAVADTATATSGSAGATQQASAQLQEMATLLREVVDSFRY